MDWRKRAVWRKRMVMIVTGARILVGSVGVCICRSWSTRWRPCGSHEGLEQIDHGRWRCSAESSREWVRDSITSPLRWVSPIAIIVLIVVYPCTPTTCNWLKRRQVIFNIVFIRSPSTIVIIVHRLQVLHHFYLVCGIIAFIRVRDALKRRH
jgi:hypothetical protein